MKIIAVDFDNTLSLGAKYPNVGMPNMELFQYLINFQRRGNVIILWTCRSGKPLEDAVEYCKRYGLTPDYVNENHPNIVNSFGGDTRKVFANLYIDNSCIKPADMFPKDEYQIPKRNSSIVRRG